MKVPCLFEIDSATNEATGIVHPFCSDTCRAKYEATSETAEGETDTFDFGFPPRCETCGRELEEDHYGKE